MSPARLRGEEGFALSTAIMVLTIVLMLGLVVLSNVDFQSRATGHEASGEAAFNLAESVLDAEAFQLQQSWPASASAAYPTCTQATVPATGCPGAALSSNFGTGYAGNSFSSPVWQVQVLDDTGGASYYSETLAGPTAAPSWDSNGDGRVWVRADATLWGQRRIVVAQVVHQLKTLPLPQNVVTAGGVSTSNNGNKTIIEARDWGPGGAKNTGLSGQISARCADTSTPSSGDPCLGWVDSKGQLDPQGNYQASYADPNGGYSTLTSLQLAQLKATAQSQGTYYNGSCPSSLAGVVYVENVSGTCTYNGGTFNSDTAPGIVVFATGALALNGNATYVGVIYMANGQGTAPTSGPCTTAQQDLVFTVHGNATVYGGIFADRCGTVNAGDSANNVNYDHAAFAGAEVFSTPALARNTFRILPNS